MSNREASGPDSPLSLRERGGGEGVHHKSEPVLGHAEFRRVRHSLGDFLQLVYLTADLLRSRLPESAVQEQGLIDHLRLRAEVCKSLVDNVQDYLSSPAISTEPVNLSEICTDLIAEFKPRYPAVDWKLSGDQSVLARADREAVIACGQQLLINAVQAGASHVTIQLQSDGDSTIRWDILDDGSGIQELDPAQLLEPFAGNRPGQAGLGLTIVARAVRAMNGDVTLCNCPNGGAQASVSLPKDEDERIDPRFAPPG